MSASSKPMCKASGTSIPFDDAHICTAHPGSEVSFDPRFGCPLCEAERRMVELHKIATGQAMVVTVRLDERTIPEVVDSLASSSERSSQALVDIRDSLGMITRLLEKLVTGTEDPLCPTCSTEMILKERKDGKGKFWSCPDWPRCKGTRPYIERKRVAPVATRTGQETQTITDKGEVVEF